MEITLKEVEVQKLNLQPDETLLVTIKSDEVDMRTIEEFKRGFSQQFPNNTIAVIGVGLNDEVIYSTIKETKV